MEQLAEETCQACNKSDSPLSTQEQDAYMERITDWEIILVEGVQRLTKKFTFKNFVDALEFTNIVGDLAEAEDHHPALLTEWGSVQVTWWTHSIGGLHHNDFVLAARTDSITS